MLHLILYCCFPIDVIQGDDDKSLIAKAYVVYNHNIYNYNLYILVVQGEDDKRLIAKADVIGAVIRSTTAWVHDFVIKYNLCPFAEQGL